MNKQQLTYFRPYVNEQDRQENGRAKKGFYSDQHHIVPSSRNEDGKNGPTIELYQDLHRAYHRVFGNAVFQEALAQMLKINGPALSDKYRKDIEEVMNMGDEYIYKGGIYIKR